MKIFLIGGFLGSGKTTAIRQGVVLLEQAGELAGVVTNDQGDQLVDTLFMQKEGVNVTEVTGSCFCCNYGEFSKSIGTLQERHKVNVIFAESVGSCTDLVATIVKPLLATGDGNISVVLSVFADVRLLYAYLETNGDIFHGYMNYIYKKQLEEADIIVVNKMDLLAPQQAEVVRNRITKTYPGTKILFQNSLEAEHVRRWLAVAGEFKAEGDRQSLDINYNDYAAGEAEMVWYDSDLTITTPDKQAAKAASQLVTAIHNGFAQGKYLIGHLKFFLTGGNHHRKISYTTIAGGNSLPTEMNWQTNKVSLIMNGRVKADPAQMKEVMQHAIMQISEKQPCTITENKKMVFRPGYPRPTHRIGNQ